VATFWSFSFALERGDHSVRLADVELTLQALR
jgi:hypothetical protein